MSLQFAIAVDLRFSAILGNRESCEQVEGHVPLHEGQIDQAEVGSNAEGEHQIKDGRLNAIGVHDNIALLIEKCEFGISLLPLDLMDFHIVRYDFQ